MGKTIKKLALEGIDGSGKSSVAEKIKEINEKLSVKTLVRSPMRIANELYGGKDVYDLWFSEHTVTDGALLLKDAVELIEEETKTGAYDLIIFDRYALSALVSIEAQHHELFTEYGPKPVPTALLCSPVELALSRKIRDQDPDINAPWMDSNELSKDAQSFIQLARKHESLVGIYQSTESIESIARTILWDLQIRR